jgi:hypothetical protein
MLKCIDMVNVNKICCICNYSVTKLLYSQSNPMYVVALLGEGGWHRTRDSKRSRKINIMNEKNIFSVLLNFKLLRQ